MTQLERQKKVASTEIVALPASEEDFEDNPATFRPEFNDIGPSNNAYDRFKSQDLVCSLAALVSICAGPSAAELEYDRIYNDKVRFSNQDAIEGFLYAVCTMGTVVMIISVAMRSYFRWKYLEFKDFESQPRVFWQSTSFFQGLIILLACIAHPNQWFSSRSVEYNNVVKDDTQQYSVNDCLSVVTISVRCFFLFRTLLLTSESFSSPRAIRVCDIHSIKHGYLFVIKSFIQTHPLWTLMLGFSFSVLMAGYALMVFERPFQNEDPFNFDNLKNTMWCVIVTELTVGYGEYSPVTWGGRITISIVCLWGIFLQSLTILIVDHYLAFKPGETRAYHLLRRLHQQERLKTASGQLLLKGYRRYKALKTYSRTSYRYRLAQDLYIKQLVKLKHLIRVSKSLYESTDTFMTTIQRTMRMMDDNLDLLKTRSKTLQESRGDISVKVSECIEILNDHPTIHISNQELLDIFQSSPSSTILNS